MGNNLQEPLINSRVDAVAGEGTTIATLLAQAMIREGQQSIAVGFIPMELRRGIEAVVRAATGELQMLSQPCDDNKSIG